MKRIKQRRTNSEFRNRTEDYRRSQTPYQQRYRNENDSFYNERNYSGNDYEDRYNQNRSSRQLDYERYPGESYNPYGEYPASRRTDEYHGNNKKHPESERYPSESYNPYGEHPASRGSEEYSGSNKRHPGLGGYDDNNERYQDRDNYFFNERYDNRKNNRNDHGHNIDLEYDDYMNREQFERPFQRRSSYDPIQSEYARQQDEYYFKRDRPYRHEGSQGVGNIEGFGIRGSRQGGEDWRDEDKYRQGLAQRKKAYGKYGSR